MALLPIKEAIRQSERRLQELLELPKKSPLYSVYMEAKVRWEKEEARLNEQTKEERLALTSDIEAWKKELKERQDGLDTSKFSNELEEAYKKIYAGTTTSHRKRLMWVSPDEDYFLVKVPGHSYTSGYSSIYCPTEWLAFRTADVLAQSQYLHMGKGGRVAYWEGGRMNMNRWKVIFQAMKENWPSEKER